MLRTGYYVEVLRSMVDWDPSQADDFRRRGEPWTIKSPAARLIGTPRKRTISAREVSHGRSNELGWSGARRGAATARVWRGGARARRQDVTPAQECGSAAAAARGRPGDRLARAGCHSRDADRLARCLSGRR